MKGASEAEENPVGALAEAIEAIKAADDLMDDDSTLNKARALETKARQDVSDLAADKFAAAQKSLDKWKDLYLKNRGNLADATENLKNQTEASKNNFDRENKGHFQFNDLDLVIYKAKLVQNWAHDFGSGIGAVSDAAKGAWLSEHPKREENKNATDRMRILIENHQKDAQGFVKQAAETIAKWTSIKQDAEKALSLQT